MGLLNLIKSVRKLWNDEEDRSPLLFECSQLSLDADAGFPFEAVSDSGKNILIRCAVDDVKMLLRKKAMLLEALTRNKSMLLQFESLVACQSWLRGMQCDEVVALLESHSEPRISVKNFSTQELFEVIVFISLEVGDLDFAEKLVKHNYWSVGEGAKSILLVNIYLFKGDIDSASKFLELPFPADRANELYALRAQVKVMQGDAQAAEECLDYLATQNIYPVGVYKMLAIAYLMQKKYELERNILLKVNEQGLGDKNIYLSLGHSYVREKDFREAEYFYRLAVTVDPRCEESAKTLANFLFSRGLIDEGKKFYVNILKIEPNIDLAYQFGFELFNSGLIEEAIDQLEDCLVRFSQIAIGAHLYNTLAIAHREVGNFNIAYKHLSKAISVYGMESSHKISIEKLQFNLAVTQRDMGNELNLIPFVDALLAINPTDAVAIFQRGIYCFSVGLYSQAWEDYERRWDINVSTKRHFPYPDWDGCTPIAGALLIYSEQGLGDEIMFSSCIGSLPADVPVVLECDDKLTEIFQRSFPEVDVIGIGSQDRANLIKNPYEAKRISHKIAVGSLPRFFRRQKEDFEFRRSYLSADQERVAYWRDRLDSLDSGPKIGISWKGGTKKTRGLLRSIAVEEFASALDEDLIYINLQYGSHINAELERLKSLTSAKIFDFSEELLSYDDTAALASALDAVLSVQTAIVHLAGSLGVKVVCCLPSVPEWRYSMIVDDKLLWYKDVTCIKQEEPQSWDGVLSSAKIMINNLVR